ncbi:pep-cterm sorting domain-containing protein [Anaeramoeba flamelloides]|uniref:Pep-cterm sorting domain-containing protein n=1 Tax=Anaeramoeba flamelloides TaxID=1746091 RepID=A0AAV7ZIV0_9EUKA|nr:pep-cterm sorting domain-containing protein [Anaeramoeba flamelloides]
MEDSLEKLFSKQFNKKEFSNVKLVVGKTKKVFYSHQFVLSMISPYWEKLFYDKNSEQKHPNRILVVFLPDVKEEIFLLFLKYLYYRKILLKKEKEKEKKKEQETKEEKPKEIGKETGQMIELYLLSEKYECEELTTRCYEYFRKQISNSNCLIFFQYFKNRGISILSNCHLQYIRNNTELLFGDVNCFRQLSKETINYLLDNNYIISKEINIFRSLINWANSEKERKSKDQENVTIKTLLKDYLPTIRLDLMDFQDLQYVYSTGIYPVEQLFNCSLRLINKYNPVLKRKIRIRKNSKILVLCSARGGEKKLFDFKKMIMDCGHKNVDLINISKSSASYKKINSYDLVILRCSNYSPTNNPQSMGNHLAKFVRNGKGLIVIAINSLIENDSFRIQGKIVEEGFIPLAVAERNTSTSRELGQVHIPDHPIMFNVNSFKCKDYTHFIGTHDINGGKLIASWDNGFPLITEKTKEGGKFGTVVCLNFHPMSTAITNGCGKAWLQETDGAEIFSNSINYLVKRSNLH